MPPRSPRSHSKSPPNRRNPIRSSRSSSAAAPSARGRPRGSIAAGRGAQGGARPRAVSSIAVPEDRGGRQEDQPWATRPDGRLVFRLALSRHLTCSSGSGTPTFLFQKAAGVQGKGVEAQAGPVQSGSQPRPQPGFRFHLRSAEPKGAGRPRGLRGGWPRPPPRHPMLPPKPGRNPGNPQDGWREQGQPPRKPRSPPPALSPSPSSSSEAPSPSLNLPSGEEPVTPGPGSKGQPG